MNYISEKAEKKLLTTPVPARYHHDPNCVHLKRYNSTPKELSDKDLVAFAKYLSPCTSCAGGAPKPSECPVKDNGPKVAAQSYPYVEMIPLWHCSDGWETGSERDALRHELELMQEKLRKGR